MYLRQYSEVKTAGYLCDLHELLNVKHYVIISKMDLANADIRYGSHGVPPNEEPLEDYLKRERSIDMDAVIKAIKAEGLIKEHPKDEYRDKGQEVIFFLLDGELYGCPFVVDFDEETKSPYIFIKNVLPSWYWSNG